MDNDMTILELLDKLEREELEFLPPVEEARKGFMTIIKFLVLSI